MKNDRKKHNLFPIANTAARIRMISNTIISRQQLAAYLGQSFNGDRELYDACGYPVTLRYNDMFAKFMRQDIAKRIVMAEPAATWRLLPEVYENEDPTIETEFEKKWKMLLKNKKIFHYLKRTDILSGIGQYAVLLLGFADGKDLKEELVRGSGKQLLYLRPYSQENASIYEWETDEKSSRYGMPKIYDLTIVTPSTLTGATANNSQVTSHLYVHHSRVIHVADGLMEDDVYGTPRLEAIYNRLQDIEFILGGSAEMFWQFGFPSLFLKADPEADWGKQEKTALESEIEDYVHGLKRILRLRGIDVQQLDPKGLDPTPLLTIELKFISGATGIPIRILIGSERGELASTQDDKNWNSRVAERRKLVGEDTLLSPLVEKLIFAGLLPNVEFFIDWPDIDSPSELEKADVSLKRMQALASYTNALGSDEIYPVPIFLEREMGLNTEEIKEIEEQIEKQMTEEQNQPEEQMTEEPADNANL